MNLCYVRIMGGFEMSIYIKNASVDINYNLSGVTYHPHTHRTYNQDDKVYLSCGHTCLISELIIEDKFGDAACFECTYNSWLEHLKIKEVDKPINLIAPKFKNAKITSVPDIYKDDIDISLGQLWKNKKTNNIVKIDSIYKNGKVAKLRSYSIHFFINGIYTGEVRGRFLKMYRRLENATS